MLISTHLNGTARPVTQMKQLQAIIQRHIDITILRYHDAEYSTGGPIEFISHLLRQIQDPGVLKRDMLDVHMWDIMESVPTISRIFDAATSGVKPRKNTFIRGTTKEIYIPTTGLVGNKVTVLDDWTIWNNIQPIKLVSHDSKELKLYWYHRPRFRLDKPNYAVFAIDVEALLLKYIVYLRQHEIGLENPSIHEFINREIIPFFYTDLVDLWLLKMMEDISYGNTPKIICTDIFVSSRFENAIGEFETFYNDTVRGKYRIGDLFKTKFFLNGTSLLDMVYTMEKLYSTSMSSKHRGYGLLKMATISNILINILSTTRSQGLETSMIRKLQYDMRLLGKSGWAAHVKDHTVLAIVANLIEHAKTLD